MGDLEQIALERFKAASEMSLQYYGLPLVVADSGGKDSSVCKELALRAGIPFEIMHNHTTADAPETVRFIRSEAKRFEELGIKYTISMPMYKGKRSSPPVCAGMNLRPGRKTGASTRESAPQKRIKSSSTTTTMISGCFLRIAV